MIHLRDILGHFWDMKMDILYYIYLEGIGYYTDLLSLEGRGLKPAPNHPLSFPGLTGESRPSRHCACPPRT